MTATTPQDVEKRTAELRAQILNRPDEEKAYLRRLLYNAREELNDINEEVELLKAIIAYLARERTVNVPQEALERPIQVDINDVNISGDLIVRCTRRETK